MSSKSYVSIIYVWVVLIKIRFRVVVLPGDGIGIIYFPDLFRDQELTTIQVRKSSLRRSKC